MSDAIAGGKSALPARRSTATPQYSAPQSDAEAESRPRYERVAGLRPCDRRHILPSRRIPMVWPARACTSLRPTPATGLADLGEWICRWAWAQHANAFSGAGSQAREKSCLSVTTRGIVRCRRVKERTNMATTITQSSSILDALEVLRRSGVRSRYDNFIGGKWVPPTTGR